MERAKENIESYYIEELHSIKEEIKTLKNEFSRFLQRVNQQHIEEILEEMRTSFMKPMVNYLCDDASERMHRQMVQDCKMRDFCGKNLIDLLQETAGLIGRRRVDSNAIKLYREKLEYIKKEAKNPNCSSCFSEAMDIFENQVKLMHSLQTYEEKEDVTKKTEISEIEPSRMASEICEPVANSQRLLILKELSGDSRTFSELSKLTGLRGGNLLFHLQKLLEAGMVLQRNERGDYIITRKGYSTLEGLSRIYSEIEQQ
ncbi:winged helix-turn-helix domain-containing protein [uncultured Methanomethylovorans sp.]|uniref:winged helix-turn-helix domain-containing protein n=1 Tax=uncultured Methanomethylovorans sp. TaxID=183759 RepID=UPI002AA68EBB|nr:winged helix-turn-helix domain-containing protein [uncultured Methanomethylovorans sp.]